MLAGAKADMKLAGALGEVGVEQNIVSTTGLWALEFAGHSVKGAGESESRDSYAGVIRIHPAHL